MLVARGAADDARDELGVAGRTFDDGVPAELPVQRGEVGRRVRARPRDVVALTDVTGDEHRGGNRGAVFARHIRDLARAPVVDESARRDRLASLGYLVIGI